MLAAFSGAIYLLTDANELFWITTGAAPMHRRAASVSSRLPEAAAGAAFHVQGGRLRIGSAMAIDLEGACVWHAPALHPDSLLDLTELPDIIRAFFSGLDLPEARGFGIFIPDILALSTGGIAGPPSESADPILRRARPLVLDAARACLEHRPGPNLQALVGLGAGLTPSGDDFLGGLLFALNTLQAAFPASPFGDHAIPVGSWEARTHPISFTLLQDLAGGHAVAPLHRLVNGLLEGDAPESMLPFVRQVTQIGGSTGWDLLAGSITGLLSVRREDPSIPSVRTIQNTQAQEGMQWT